MISGLHHYTLEVPDLAVAEGFLQDFGLETGEEDGTLVAQYPGRDQKQVRLVQAPAMTRRSALNAGMIGRQFAIAVTPGPDGAAAAREA